MAKNPDTKNTLKDVLYTVIGLLLGLALLVSGIYGIVSGRIEKRNYQNSDDVRRGGRLRGRDRRRQRLL